MGSEGGRSERYRRGWEQLTKLNADAVQGIVDGLQDVAPDLGAYIVESGFGDIFSRPGLDAPRREMVIISVLAATGGCDPQLRFHVEAALNVGVSAQEVVEVLMQCSPYIGYARALNAVGVAKAVFAERGLLPLAPVLAPRDEG
jgi:4-carboxymuconolactone decarboxylase